MEQIPQTADRQSPNILKGILFCCRCGEPMKPESINSKPHYKCGCLHRERSLVHQQVLAACSEVVATRPLELLTELAGARRQLLSRIKGKVQEKIDEIQKRIGRAAAELGLAEAEGEQAYYRERVRELLATLEQHQETEKRVQEQLRYSEQAGVEAQVILKQWGGRLEREKGPAVRVPLRRVLQRVHYSNKRMILDCVLPRLHHPAEPQGPMVTPRPWNSFGITLGNVVFAETLGFRHDVTGKTVEGIPVEIVWHLVGEEGPRQQEMDKLLAQMSADSLAVDWDGENNG